MEADSDADPEIYAESYAETETEIESEIETETETAAMKGEHRGWIFEMMTESTGFPSQRTR